MTIVEHLPERRWSVGVPVSGGGLRSGHHIVDLASRRAPGGLVEEFLTTTSSEAGTQTSSYPDEAEDWTASGATSTPSTLYFSRRCGSG